MADIAERKPTKDRSPNFPFISLGQALERARLFFAKERRGSAPLEAAATHWKYSPTSSGLQQTIGALKQYGLMQDEGMGSARKVRLTELALRILLDSREDSAEKEAYQREAALMPVIATEINEKWPEGLPSDATLSHFLVLERGFNPVNASKVIRILKENDGFTLLRHSDSISEHSKNEFESTSMHTAVLASDSTSRIVDMLVQRKIPQTRQQIGPFPVSPNCSVMIVVSGELTQASWGTLTKYMELVKDTLPKDEASAPDQTASGQLTSQ